MNQPSSETIVLLLKLARKMVEEHKQKQEQKTA